MIRFANRIVAAGMTVFLPVLFGEPGRPVTSGYARYDGFEDLEFDRLLAAQRLRRGDCQVSSRFNLGLASASVT